MGTELLVIIERTLGQNPLLAYLAVFAGGILFGFAPCALAVIPLTIGFVGGYAGGDKKKAFFYSLAFVLGLSITLMILGVIAALMGTLFGKIGNGWYLFISLLAMAMGLNLIGVFEFRFSFAERIKPGLTGPLGAFLLGLLFGVISTPCSAPVLVILLAFVAAKGQLLYGATLLLTYGVGQSLLVLLAGTFTGIVDSLAESRGLTAFSKYLKIVSGVLVLLVGLYVFFSHL